MKKPLATYLLGMALVGVAGFFCVASAWAQDPAPAEAAPAPPPAPAEAAPAPPPAEAAPPAPPPLADVRQIQVKVWISETTETGIRDIGANLDFTRFVRGEEQSTSLQEITTNTMTVGDRFGTTALPYPSTTLFGEPTWPDINSNLTDGLQAYRGAGLDFAIIKGGYGTVDGIIHSMERKADVDLISKPELLVANGLPATVKAGGKIPFQDVLYPKNPYGQRMAPELQVSWRDVGVTLGLTPTIQPNDYIQLSIDKLEVSEMNRIDNLRGIDLPVFSTRSQTGVVFVPNGTTLVVGGLTSRAVRKTERRVPVLGNIPLLGIPFRSRKSEAEMTSLLIFVSPTIVDTRAPTPQASSAVHFWRERGSAWENRPRIESEIKAMEEGL